MMAGLLKKEMQTTMASDVKELALVTSVNIGELTGLTTNSLNTNGVLMISPCKDMAGNDVVVDDTGQSLASLLSDDVQRAIPVAEAEIDGDSCEEGEVLVVYPDFVVCGTCAKQFTDVVELMEHKTEHLLGGKVYKCELCKILYMDRQDLIVHYRKTHGIEEFCENQDIQDAKWSKPQVTQIVEKIKTHERAQNARTGKKQYTYQRKKDMNKQLEALHEKHNAHQEDYNEMDEVDTDFVKSEDETDECSQESDMIKEEKTDTSLTTSGENSENSHSPDKTVIEENEFEKKISDGDYMFVLCSVNVKKNSLSFEKNFYRCVFCGYKTQVKSCLAKHMYKHKPAIEESVLPDLELSVGHEVKGEVQKVLRMCDYEKELAASRAQTNRASRRRSGSGKIGACKNGAVKKKRGIETQDLLGDFNCKQCGKHFTRLRYLRKHIKTHTDSKKFQCDECGKCFKTQNYLSIHRKSHLEKVYKCSQCGFTTTVSAVIHAHRQIHREGSVLCDLCGFAYTDKSTLKKHKQVHDPSRPFACNFPGCTWRFKTEVMCKAHIRAHTTEGRFRCTLCGYVFRHKHHLQRHESNMHKIKHDKVETVTQETSEEILEDETICEEDMDIIEAKHMVELDQTSSAVIGITQPQYLMTNGCTIIFDNC